MITIKKIYLEPDDINGYIFKPINFHKGINFILGERSASISNEPEHNKMNGVGKSVLIEIIDYCFLKDLSKSRLNFIPDHMFTEDTLFCMDLEVSLGDSVHLLTVKRSRLRKGTDVHIFVDDEEITFEKIEDAKEYLERYLVLLRSSDTPSLRSLLSIILRTEKTLYGDIFFTDANSKRFPYSDLLKPHLYLFGFKLEAIEDIKKLLQNKKDIKKTITLLKADFKEMNLTADEVNAHLSDLEDKVEKLNLSIEGLAPAEVSLQKKQELKDKLLELDRLTSLRVSKEYLLRKIQTLPEVKNINTKNLSSVYNNFKDGLGDYIARSFDDVLVFRKEIEKFQTDLVINKQRELRDQIREISERIGKVDAQISSYYKANIATKKLDDLTEAAVNQKEKDDELTALKYKNSLYIDSNQKKLQVEASLNALYSQLDDQLRGLSANLRSFNQDLSSIHEAIAGNKRSYFELKINPKSQEYIQTNYRIKLDGSMGIDRIKTFIYDVLLMTNKHTSIKHPGFLIHDNIFAATGRDDMVKSLNYLAELEHTNPDFQYIVTINKDEFESYTGGFSFDVDSKIKKTLTRERPLFGAVYDESK